MTFRFSTQRRPGRFTFGPGGHGVRGDALAQNGTHGRGILADDVALPAEAADEFAYRITTMPPLLTLFRWFDDGGVEAEGPVGVHTGVAEARKNGVVYGSAPFNVVIGGGVLAGTVVLDDAAPSGTLGQAAPSQLSGGVTTDPAQPSGALGVAPPTVLSGAITTDNAAPSGLLSGVPPSPELVAMPEYTLGAPQDQILIVGGTASLAPGQRGLIAFDFRRFTSAPINPQVTVLHESGPVDPDPGAVKRGNAEVQGTKVFQYVESAIDEANYTLICTAEGADGQEFLIAGRLPIRSPA